MTAQRLVTRQRSNVVGQPRSVGVLPFLPGGSPPPRFLGDAVVRAADGDRRIAADVWEGAIRQGGDDFGLFLSHVTDDDEPGGISILAVEVLTEG